MWRRPNPSSRLECGYNVSGHSQCLAGKPATVKQTAAVPSTCTRPGRGVTWKLCLLRIFQVRNGGVDGLLHFRPLGLQVTTASTRRVARSTPAPTKAELAEDFDAAVTILCFIVSPAHSRRIRPRRRPTSCSTAFVSATLERVGSGEEVDGSNSITCIESAFTVVSTCCTEEGLESGISPFSCCQRCAE